MNRKVIQAFWVVAILLLAASFFVAGVPGSVLTVGAIAFAIAALVVTLAGRNKSRLHQTNPRADEASARGFSFWRGRVRIELTRTALRRPHRF